MSERRSSPYDRDPYRPRASSGSSSPYGDDVYGSAYGSGREYTPSPSSPYAEQPSRRPARDPYAAGQSRSRDAAGRQQRSGAPRQAGGRQQPTAYPVGSGQAYSSNRRPNNATGVTPVSSNGYRGGTYRSGGNLTPQNNSRNEISRRTLIRNAGFGVLAAAFLGFAGVAWYTHRSVACTINGTVREAPVGSSPQELIDRGYAKPLRGNLVAICAEGETPTVIEKGAGDNYMLAVNGVPVDVEQYRLNEGDVLEFINGTDVTEDVIEDVTEIPCGIQIPDPSMLLATIGYVAQWGRNGKHIVQTGTRSGRTVDRGVTQEAQDLIITHRGINPDDGRLLVALTFDDGPSLTYTPQYLDILARYGAKATFFNLGDNIGAGEEYKALARRVVQEGHQLASHTCTHNSATLSGLDATTREWEISNSFALIKDAAGVDTNVFRPPYGEFRGWQYLQYMKDTGLDIAYSAYWSVDSSDWELPGASAIVSNCTAGLSGDNYNGAVILMHDGGGDRSQDVEALPIIIETFQAAGYQLVTMDELISADSTIPAWVGSGNATRPADAVIPDTSAYF